MASEQELETMKHIQNVNIMINKVRDQLFQRGVEHDKSKLETPEAEVFEEFTPKLKTSTYGSEEYKSFLTDMKPALDHHYANNAHHPEHFLDGIDDMNIIDLIEMFCDWKAATLRHNDGNLNRSITVNKKRFKIGEQLEKILNNSVRLFED